MKIIILHSIWDPALVNDFRIKTFACQAVHASLLVVCFIRWNEHGDTDADVLVFKGDKMLFTVTIGNEIKNE